MTDNFFLKRHLSLIIENNIEFKEIIDDCDNTDVKQEIFAFQGGYDDEMPLAVSKLTSQEIDAIKKSKDNGFLTIEELEEEHDVQIKPNQPMTEYIQSVIDGQIQYIDLDTFL